MKKRYYFLMLVVLLVLMAGCGKSFAKADYNNLGKIARTEDRYSKVNSAFTPIENGYKLTVGKFDGRETLWTKNIKENKDIEVEINLSLSAGTAKVVYVDEDGNIEILAEFANGSSDVTEVVKTVSLKQGKNRIKVVGYKCENLSLTLLSKDFK